MQSYTGADILCGCYIGEIKSGVCTERMYEILLYNIMDSCYVTLYIIFQVAQHSRVSRLSVHHAH